MTGSSTTALEYSSMYFSFISTSPWHRRPETDERAGRDCTGAARGKAPEATWSFNSSAIRLAFLRLESGAVLTCLPSSSTRPERSSS